ncbi:MAG: hypothetical protein FJ053_00945 [Cyanobacteria bacterium M_surface_10_m1_298]|nr:hypothetical protein [Cyanobacteria bacterium M_surface_10_m1_298]
MDELHRSDFQPVLRTLQQSFAGDRGVGRAFWQLGLLEKVMAHNLTPDRLKEACDLVRSYELAVDYVMEASDLHEAWSRSLEVLTATNDLLAWAAELNLIVSRSAKSEF